MFRCHVEGEVFLIHGSYQFSCFESGSAAFATIMMDYRPDGKAIRVKTCRGIREYGGRFLGALLKERAKSLGGSGGGRGGFATVRLPGSVDTRDFIEKAFEELT